MVSFCLQLLVWHTAITMATAENPIKAPTLLMFSQGRFWDAMPCISDLWSPTCKSRCRSVAPSVNPDKPRDQREPFGSYQVLSPWPRSLAPNLGGANHVGVHHITWRWGAPQTPTERCGKGWLLLVVTGSCSWSNSTWSQQEMERTEIVTEMPKLDSMGWCRWLDSNLRHPSQPVGVKTYTMNIRAISGQTFEKKIENIQTAFPSLFHMKSIY